MRTSHKLAIITLAATLGAGCDDKSAISDETFNNTALPVTAKITPLEAELEKRFPDESKRQFARRVAVDFGQPVEKLEVGTVSMHNLGSLFGGSWKAGEYIRVRVPNEKSYYFSRKNHFIGHLEKDTSQKASVWNAYAAKESGYQSHVNYSVLKVTEKNQFELQKILYKESKDGPAYTEWVSDNSFVLKPGEKHFRKTADENFFNKNIHDGRPGTIVFSLQRSEKFGDTMKFSGYLEIRGPKKPEYLGDGEYDFRYSLDLVTLEGPSIEKAEKITVQEYSASEIALAVFKKYRPDLKITIIPDPEIDSE